MNAAIILAAGASSRLGHPKQLLMHRGKTLLQHTIDEALAAGSHPVIVVLGAAFEIIAATIKNAQVLIIENKDWKSGIGTSIRAGIHQLNSIEPGVNAAWLLLCDQPYVTSRLLLDMQTLANCTAKKIVACAYSDTLGVPLLVDRSYFDKLLALPDDMGAKVLLAVYRDDIASLPFAEGAIDIDTVEDYAAIEFYSSN